MTGKKVGYIRVSTAKQSTERQLSDLELDITFTDHASGKDTNRPKRVNHKLCVSSIFYIPINHI